MPRVYIEAAGVTIEIEDADTTSIKLTNLAMKTLKEAVVLTEPKHAGPSGVVGAGFHTEKAEPRIANPYAPTTLHPDVKG